MFIAFRIEKQINVDLFKQLNKSIYICGVIILSHKEDITGKDNILSNNFNYLLTD